MTQLVKLVICRKDLPRNPNWRLENYPIDTCWDVDEFMASDLVPYSEKRRIFWECLPPFIVVPALVDGHFMALKVSELVGLLKGGHTIEVLSPRTMSPRSFRKPPKFTRVLAARVRRHEGVLVRILTHYGREIICTPEHVIPAYRNDRLTFIRAIDITRKDRLFVDHRYEIPQGNEVSLVSASVAELLGYALSEGCYVAHYAKKWRGKWYTYPAVSIACFDPRIREHVKRLAREGGFWVYSRSKKPEDLRIGFSKALTALGAGERLPRSYEKEIPPRLFWLPKSHILSFLRALYSGDGCVKTEKGGCGVVVDYATTSYVMAQQLYWLLRYVGFKYIRVEQERTPHRPIYRLQLSNLHDIQHFLSNVGFVQEEKNEALREAIEKGLVAQRAKLKRTVPVRRVELIPYKGLVYDIALEKPHVYYAGFGLLIHNCYWRLLGRYRRERPFFDTYLIDRRVERVEPERWRWVCENVIISAMEHDVVPPEAKETTERLYRRLFGRLVRAIVGGI